MNYYELLNITRDADGNAVKRAYFSAVKLHSPDSDPEGFKAVRIAYETLSDQKKRAEYDGYFIADGGGNIATEIQNDLLTARSLIRENKYKQAVEFLTEISGKNPDSTEAKRLLAEVLWRMKKSGTAVKLCEELLEKNPTDLDTLLLRAKIAASQGHTTKAGNYYDDAAYAAPQNPIVWIEYMHYAMNHARWEIASIFHRAMEQDPEMFRNEYFLYLVGAHDLNLFNNELKMQYYYKFAEFFLNDKNPDENTYSHVMKLMPGFIENEELVPFVEKILPALENSKQRREEDEENFECIRIAIVAYNLRLDKRIHDVLTDLTLFLLTEGDDKNEQLTMECYIIFNLSLLRPSIKVLMNEYPDFFKLNQTFYLDALNEKKTDFLTDKYIGIQKKLISSKKGMPDYSETFDDFNEETTPFVRESQKIGRNVPCPCGSGKKYKKCCG